MRKSRLLLLTVIAGLGLTLSACNEASLPLSSEYPNGVSSDDLAGTIETPWNDYTLPATSVTFPEEDKVVNLNKGDTYTYHPTITPKEAKIQALTFTSQNLDVAHVINGVLTAVGGGSTTIVVTSAENTIAPITLEVNVTVPVTGINVSPSALDLGYGYQQQLNVTYVPEDTTQKGVAFEVIDVAPANANVVTVNEDGLVTAGTDTGTAKIKVTSPFLNTAETVTINVEDKVIHVEAVNIINKQSTVEIDKQIKINAAVAPENAEDKEILYESSKPDVASIDAAGNISALKEGTTKISAISHENSAIKDEFDLEVYAIKADAIDVPASVDLVLNATEQLHPVYKKAGETVVPSRGALTYTSDNTAVATVSAGGLISAKSVGTANITVKDTTDPLINLEATVVVNVSLDVATFSITGFADWTPNDGAVVFAWAWGGDTGYPGKWYSVALSYEGANNDYSNVAGTFEAPRNIEGFVLVRCKVGTTAPDWEIKTDEVGRIYNKTEDVTVIGTSFVAPEWTDYPEPEKLEGYGLKFGSGVNVQATLTGTDPSGRDQYEMNGVKFAAGATFQIYDFTNEAGWVEDVEGWSFGGDSAESEAWKSYLSKGATEYTVLVDFTADIFLKIAYGNNSIYFGLSTGPVVADSYAVKIGNTTTELVEGPADPAREGELKSFSATGLEVTAGESITFYANNSVISANIGPDPDDEVHSAFNNYYGSMETAITIQADNADAGVYLHIYESGISFWISGGNSATHYDEPDLPDSGYGLLFKDGSTYYQGADKGESEGYHQYLVSYEHFAAGAQFRLYDFANKAGWTVDIDPASFGGEVDTYIEIADGYYRIKSDLYADVWIKLKADADQIYFGLKETPIVLASEYKVKVGSTTEVLTPEELTPEEIADGKIGRFTVTMDVVADEVLSFLGDDVAITSRIGANDDGEAPNYNNYKKNATTWKIQANKSDAFVELNAYKGGYSFWISGGNSADHEIPPVTFAVTFEFDTSVFDGWDPAVSDISLYVFGTDAYAPVAWAECTGNLDDGNITFNVNEDCDLLKAVFFFSQGGVEKQSTDIAFAAPITEAGTYIVNFVNHWAKVSDDPEVWKLDEMTITPKALALNKNSVSVEKETTDTSVIASNWMGPLTVDSDDESVATATINTTTGVVSIVGVAAGSTTVTVSDGITDREIAVTVTNPVVTYAVTFEFNTSVFDGWDPAVEDISLYVFGTGDYIPVAWASCAGNLDDGDVTFNIPTDKDITGAVFYFSQGGEEKQSTDIDLSITAAGTYVVNYVDHWAKVSDDPEVWKLDSMTITPKVLLINKTEVSVVKENSDSTVIASNWMGPLEASSDDTGVATVAINTSTGVVTITGVAAGTATITITDGITNRTVDVTVTNPVLTYAVTFEFDTSVFDGWSPTVTDISLYVFGTGDYIPVAWASCAGNLGTGTVTFNIAVGKDITGVVLYFNQGGEGQKQSTDIAVSITAAGTYTVNFVNHWAKVSDDPEVWKLDQMTVTPKP